jgi:hypothetical protein
MARIDCKSHHDFRINHNHQTLILCGLVPSIHVNPIFNSEGTLLFVTISDILVVYNAENGDVVTKPTKAGTTKRLTQLRMSLTVSHSHVTANFLPRDRNNLLI